MTGDRPADTFPSNDILLPLVLEVLQADPDGKNEATITRAIAARTGSEHLLTGRRRDRKVVGGAVRFCLEILEREGLAIAPPTSWRRPNPNAWKLTASGRSADETRVNKAWQAELLRVDWFDGEDLGAD